MKQILIISISLLLTSCGRPSFEKEFYERVTEIKFPKDYKVIASADNSEYVTVTILDLNKSDCNKFIQDNKFHQLDTSAKKLYRAWKPELNGLKMLDSAFWYIPDKNLLENSKRKEPGNVGWTYYIDTVNCRLYCQINYPDAGGN